MATPGCLSSHLKLHKEVKEKFKCPSCEKSFVKENEQKNHIFTVHEGHKDNKCALCGKECKDLKIHVRDVHENADRRDNLCTLCGKKFKQSETLRKHMLSVHEGKNDFKCEFCEYCTFIKARLKKHIDGVHEKKKDYTCDSCGKSYFSSNLLKMHIRVAHEGRKDYTCKICGKNFGVLGTLRTHTRIVHENVTKHECELCKKRFFARLKNLMFGIEKANQKTKSMMKLIFCKI